MDKNSPQMIAGNALRKLIKKYYPSQDEFAYDFDIDLRSVSRYVNSGIDQWSKITKIADFFDMTWLEFMQYGMEE